MAVLALVTTATLYKVGPRHATTFHSASWNEALASAEAGADMALLAMNASRSTNATTKATAWTNWVPPDPTEPDVAFSKSRNTLLGEHGGDGNTKVYVKVTVDNSIIGASSQRWMRITSTGVAELPSASRSGIESAVFGATGTTKSFRNVLRKPLFGSDLTGGALHMPQIARTIQVMAAPSSASKFKRALLVSTLLSFSGSAYTDSFDSSDPAKSTNGQYDPTKRQENGDVAVNANGDASNFRNVNVYGAAASKGGTIQNQTNVTGAKTNNFDEVIDPVLAPSPWSTTPSTPNIINNPTGGMTLGAGNYKLSSITISQDTNPLLLGNSSWTPGQPLVEVNIWVTGETKVQGSGFIRQWPGTVVHMYVEGNVSITGSGFVNQTNKAENLIISGIDPSGTTTPTIILSGSATFIGVLDAPKFALTASATFIGSAIAKTASITGGGGFHYDEDLANMGGKPGNSYRFLSWVEDIR